MARRDLEKLLKFRAHEICNLIEDAPAEPVKGEYIESALIVRIEVVPVAVAGEVTATPGKWLSPYEQSIWAVLADGPLLGKQIASKLGWAFDPSTRLLLSNLVNREVLTNDDGAGYARAK
jgi:hypothetical protein